MPDAIPCTVMRGGTSKGLYFLRSNLPADADSRNQLLQRILGSPDVRQIDGMGGGHPLTSKVAIVSPSSCDDADIDYLFLQVVVDTGDIRDAQNCGNILSGVGPFAIDQGLVKACGNRTDVRIRMLNSGGLAIARVQTPDGRVSYAGDATIDGVPGTAAPVMLEFEAIAGATCGALFPTGNVVDEVDGLAVTAIDNGMPVVIVAAGDVGKSGYESPAVLEADSELAARIERVRCEIGPAMRLGNVATKTVPKVCVVAQPRGGGTISTRTYIPHRVHDAVGVLGAVSVASACVIPGTIASRVTQYESATGTSMLGVEHPGGEFQVELELDEDGNIQRAALLRTARKLMEGVVFC